MHTIAPILLFGCAKLTAIKVLKSRDEETQEPAGSWIQGSRSNMDPMLPFKHFDRQNKHKRMKRMHGSRCIDARSHIEMSAELPFCCRNIDSKYEISEMRVNA